MATMTAPRPAAPPSLPDWRRDPRLAELNRRRDALDQQAQAIDSEISNAERRLAAAEAVIEPLEVAILAGIQQDHSALDKARTAVADARAGLEAARGRTDSFADERRKIAGALVIVADEAKLAARRGLQAPYRAALARLDECLAAAHDASEEVYRIWRASIDQFGWDGERSSRGVYHASGLIRANWHELRRIGDPSAEGESDANFSKYERWHRDLSEDAFIVEMPAAPQPAPTGLPGVLRRMVSDITKPDPTPQRRLVVEADEASEGWVGR